MALFDTSYSITNKREGGYVNDKDDKGGETYKGIARKKHPDWEGWKIIDEVKSRNSPPEADQPGAEKIKIPLPGGARGGLNEALDANNVLQQLIKKFYFEEYWLKIKGDLISDQRIADEVYDNAVHMGVSKSSKYLQRTINILNRNCRSYNDIKVDGKIGPKSLLALNAAMKANGVKRVVNVINGYQIKHYLECMEKNPVNKKYTGWFDRVEIVWN
jgi:lysozyme family protein